MSLRTAMVILLGWRDTVEAAHPEHNDAESGNINRPADNASPERLQGFADYSDPYANGSQ